MIATASKNPFGGKRRTVMILVALIVAMASLSAAAVPLYRLFCQATGYGGTPKTQSVATGISSPSVLAGRPFTIHFDHNISSRLPWNFYPERRFIQIHSGEENTIHYYATNRSPEENTGMAMFNVTPMAAAKYFHKIECFCFNEQTLGGGQTAKMPVIFTVDPAIDDDSQLSNVDAITLSYTFFPAEDLEE